jgi:ParB/RepB/Spo0J family partition protein
MVGQGVRMDLELGQLDLRYERLRVQSRERDRRLVASLSEVGQLVPIVVVSADEAAERLVVIDGVRRVHALRRLRRDLVQALRWDLSEVEALFLRRSLQSASAETTLEQAWLVAEMRGRFGLSLEELARRFDRSPSWVSRRLALIGELPESVQEFIRRGQIVPHAAAKYLVPLARANREQCEHLARAIAPDRLSSREIGELYSAWRDAAPAVRERLVADPILFLKTRRAAAEAAREDPSPHTSLLEDVALIAAVSRRARRRLHEGVVSGLTLTEGEKVRCALGVAQTEIERLARGLEVSMEGDDARSGDEGGDSHAHEEGRVDPPDCANTWSLAGDGLGRQSVGNGRGSPARACGESHAFS